MKVDKKTRKRIITWSLTVGLFIVFSYAIWYRIYFNNVMESYGKYTIGVTKEKYRVGRGSLRISHKFKYKGEKYKGEGYPDAENIKYPGGRYLVKFSTKDPEVSEIDFYQPVPESLEAPSEGWSEEELPEGLEGW